MENVEVEAIAREMVDEILSGRILDRPAKHEDSMSPEARGFVGGLIQASRGSVGATCMAPLGACDRPAIESHAIQRAALDRIAEKGHVVRFESFYKVGELVGIKAELKGINRVTIFHGLCADHDKRLFRSIEDSPLDPENHSQPLLLGYRSVLAHMARQRRMKRGFEIISKQVAEKVPGSPLAVALDEMAVRGHFCFEVVSIYKGLYDRVLAGRIPADELFCLPLTLPLQAFASTCFFSPSHGFDGTALPSTGIERAPAFVSLSVIPGNGETYAVVVFARDDFDLLRGLVGPLMMMEDEELSERLFELALRFDDGLVIAPTAWAALSELQQEQILEFKQRSVGSWLPFDCVMPGQL